MRILLLTHSFNSLAQRIFAELAADGHDLSVEFDIADSVVEEAVALFRPDVILAPFLKRAVPESIWSRHLTLIVHPGIVGDRGPSALDWAIMNGEREWGVTVLQAEAEMDAGPVWAESRFAMRDATKASLYRNEVTAAAIISVRAALTRVPDWRAGEWQPFPLCHCEQMDSTLSQAHGSPLLALSRAEASATRSTKRGAATGEGGILIALSSTVGTLRPLMKQQDRTINWSQDDTATILKKIRAADGFPGVADSMFGTPCHLFDTHPATPDEIPAGAPGEIVARRDGAVLRVTRDGAVWIGHIRRADGDHRFKLPATLAFADETARLPEQCLPLMSDTTDTRWRELRYRETDNGTVGFLAFEFYNGAMSTAQCERLTAAIAFARTRPTKVLVFEGGRDYWSNGIHLNTIETAASPADESWANINAMNDVCLAVLTLTDRITVAALRGNAGAGGCFLALAADEVWARDGVILNPHYKNMGNLYGSEYWSYLLPKRIGADAARRTMQQRLPLTAARAADARLIDACFGDGVAAFESETGRRATALASDPTLNARIACKAETRARDEAEKPLEAYRAEELAQMKRNFYGFDPSYHVARYHFVLKSPHSWTPRHLARHRDLGWAVPEASEQSALMSGS